MPPGAWGGGGKENGEPDDDDEEDTDGGHAEGFVDVPFRSREPSDGCEGDGPGWPPLAADGAAPQASPGAPTVADDARRRARG